MPIYQVQENCLENYLHRHAEDKLMQQKFNGMKNTINRLDYSELKAKRGSQELENSKLLISIKTTKTPTGAAATDLKQTLLANLEYIIP